MSVDGVLDRPLRVQDVVDIPQEPTLFFDPRRDISSERWDLYKETLKQVYPGSITPLPEFIEYTEATFQVLESVIKGNYEALEERRNTRDEDWQFWIVIRNLAFAKLSFPQEFEKFILDNPQYDPEKFVPPGGLDFTLPNEYLPYKVLHPEFQLNDKEWNNYKDTFFSPEDYLTNDPWDAGRLIKLLAETRLAEPDRFNELEIPPRRIWDLALVRFDNENDPSLVEALIILSAYDARITDHGIQITQYDPNKPLEVLASSPLPETRRFS